MGAKAASLLYFLGFGLDESSTAPRGISERRGQWADGTSEGTCTKPKTTLERCTAASAGMSHILHPSRVSLAKVRRGHIMPIKTDPGHETEACKDSYEGDSVPWLPATRSQKRINTWSTTTVKRSLNHSLHLINSNLTCVPAFQALARPNLRPSPHELRAVRRLAW